MKENRIRLFVDAHCFDSEYQGSRTFVKEIYQLLSQKKDILLYIGAYDIANLSTIFPKMENIIFLKYKTRSSLFRLAVDIPLLIKKHRIEVAHFQYITPFLKNCRQVVTIHDVLFNDFPKEFSFPYQLIKKFLYRRSVLQADVLTTVSPFSKTSIEKHLGGKNKIHVIANGVNPEFFKPYDKRKAKAFIKEKYGFDKFILYVSRVEPRKNHIVVFRVFQQLALHRQGYHLVFLGHKTKGVPQLKKELSAAEPYLRKHLYFNSGVGDSDLVQFYRAADIFIYPSKAEGFGIPPLEAAAAKIPVICSNTSAMKAFTFFEDRHIDPADHVLLRNKLSEMIRQEHDIKKLSIISENIKKTYSWDQSAEQLYQLIKNHGR
jgi:glycosyltransferase involved in cell wall biosynthesis